ncbi:MAG: hypothetical protein IJF31_04015, partial [Clostridia bacterium]|nr:hypothetical protein [Clostridia bacterium]
MLKAGFAKLDVTPPFGTGIAGYFRERKVKGILDPIYLCCLAVEKDGERLLIITGDFMGIKMGVCKRMAESIEARTGVPATSVIVQALHPHTSTALNTQPVLNHVHEGTYFDLVMMKAGDVAELALADLDETTLTGATGEVAEKISFVRRYFMKDGTVKTNPGFDKAADIIGPCDEPDNSVRLLRFKREKGDIALVNFACHPDVIGGELLSADWPGFVRRFVEAEHPGTACIFCNGFQGDSNHFHYMSGVRKGGYEHSRFMGRVVADAVNALWEQVTPIKADSVGVKSETVYTKTRMEELERYDELKAFHDAYWAVKHDYTPSGEVIARARRVTDLLT